MSIKSSKNLLFLVPEQIINGRFLILKLLNCAFVEAFAIDPTTQSHTDELYLLWLFV